MQTFDVVRLDSRGREAGRFKLKCETEEEAMDRAALLCWRSGLEVWAGPLLIWHWAPLFK